MMSATRSSLATNVFITKNNPSRLVSFEDDMGQNFSTSRPYPRYSPPSERATALPSRKRRSTGIKAQVRTPRTLEMELGLCSRGSRRLKVGKARLFNTSCFEARNVRFAPQVWSGGREDVVHAVEAWFGALSPVCVAEWGIENAMC